MKTILLIEDDKSARDALQEQMETERYNIIPAADGTEGIKLAKIFTPDLIICSLKLPLMNGKEVLRELLKIPRTRNIPFILSSPTSEKMQPEEALQLGAAGIIAKPFVMEDIFKKVNSLLKGRRE